MPLTIHEIKSYDEHQKLAEDLKDKIVYFWYVAAKLPSTGQSWCGDCRETEPVIRDYLNTLKIRNDLDVHVIYVELEKEYFRSSDCDFKKDPKINIQKVPTLYNPRTQQRLLEQDCKEKNLLDELFRDAN